MQTRRMTRISTTHDVILNVDLLTQILLGVEGDHKREISVCDTIPLVCSAWREAWKCIVRRSPPKLFRIGFSVYTSLAIRNLCIMLYARMDAEYRARTAALRSKYLTMLRCSRDGVPSLLGHAVVDIAFHPLPPPQAIRRKTPGLWEYIGRVRHLAARDVIRLRIASKEFPLLPPWFHAVFNDPMQVALMSVRG